MVYFLSASRLPSVSALPTDSPPRRPSTSFFNMYTVTTELFQQTPGLTLVLGQRQQEQFRGDILVATLLTLPYRSD